MDILQATLAAGIRVAKYVPSYGDQPNDVQHVTKCAHVPRTLSAAAAHRFVQTFATSFEVITYVQCPVRE